MKKICIMFMWRKEKKTDDLLTIYDYFRAGKRGSDELDELPAIR